MRLSQILRVRSDCNRTSTVKGKSALRVGHYRSKSQTLRARMCESNKRANRFGCELICQPYDLLLGSPTVILRCSKTIVSRTTDCGASAGGACLFFFRKRRSRGAHFFSFWNSASAESRKVQFGRRILHCCRGSHHERCRSVTAKNFDATHRVSPLVMYIETQAWPIASTIAC